jgi:murein DD-endopeptidase MepM/ murein hydrolase activator NlpD
MRKSAFLAVLLLIATFLAVGNTQTYAQAESKVVVKKGDSLSKIANRFDTTYQRIFFANKKIQNPDLIYPGWELRIPDSNEKLEKRALPTQKTATAPAPKQQDAPRKIESTQKPQQPKPAPVSNQSTNQTRQQTQPAPRTSVSTSVWDRLAQCESSGNWSINTGNGYYGGLQFSLSSWRYVGGTGYPHQASKAEQIKRAEMLLAKQGWNAWPACTAKLGLR